MKKLSTIIVFTLLAALLAAPSLAWGGRGVGSRHTAHTVCPSETCTLVGQHVHGVNSHTEHHYGDGHDYHDYCTVDGCATVGYHDHDGVYCFGRVSDVRGYRNREVADCTVDGCTTAGYHDHDGAQHHNRAAGGGGHHNRAGRGCR